jgi:hypothetical protein
VDAEIIVSRFDLLIYCLLGPAEEKPLLSSSVRIINNDASYFARVNIRSIRNINQRLASAWTSTMAEAKSFADLPKFDDREDKKRFWPAKPGSRDEGLGMLRYLTPAHVAQVVKSEVQTGERVCIQTWIWDERRTLISTNVGLPELGDDKTGNTRCEANGRDSLMGLTRGPRIQSFSL